MMKVRVISDTTTFYPVEQESVESHHRNDNMSLRTTLLYLREQLKEDFQYFTAGDQFVVLQQWRGMLFFIQTTDVASLELLRLTLQTIREILIFLFGKKFESVMRRNISLSKRLVFSQYVDSYLALAEYDYIYLLNSIRIDHESSEIGAFFLQEADAIASNFDIHLLSVVIFNDHKIVTRYEPQGKLKLDPETYTILSVFEKVEYQTLENPIKVAEFNPDYVKSANNNSMKHKNAFLRLERTPVACTLSSSRSTENSSFVILAVTQNAKVPDEMREKIVDFISSIASRLSSLIIIPQPSIEIETYPCLIHYILLDRTNGRVWEYPIEESLIAIESNLSPEQTESPEEIFKSLTKRLSVHGMTAMMKGFTTMMWGELDYQFCYELRFVDQNGEFMKPEQVFIPPPFNDDNGINYKLITNSIFQTEENVTCLELFSVFVGAIPVKSTLSINSSLFAQILPSIH